VWNVLLSPAADRSTTIGKKGHLRLMDANEYFCVCGAEESDRARCMGQSGGTAQPNSTLHPAQVSSE
jgi:hypothetical protein